MLGHPHQGSNWKLEALRQHVSNAYLCSKRLCYTRAILWEIRANAAGLPASTFAASSPLHFTTMQKIKSNRAALYCALMLFPLGSAQLQAQGYQGNTTPAWLKNGGNLYVAPTVKIGIGTSTPTRNLDVYSNTGSTYLRSVLREVPWRQARRPASN
jgi:hypothetical protein